jgi:predicted membrane-bound mannosyltransferase
MARSYRQRAAQTSPPPEPARLSVRLSVVLTAYGVVVLTFMMLMYALERRGPRFILAFACGCALSSVYGFLAGTWPFGVVEAIWAVIALRRYGQKRLDAN